MNIRTPKRYRKVQRRSIFPMKRFLFLIFVVGVVFAGIQIMNNRVVLQQQVEQVMLTASENIGQQMSTISAPPPTSTSDPAQFLIAGDNAWAVGNTSEAVRNYQTSLGSIPNNVNIHNRVAMGLILSGNTQEAVEYAGKAVMADPYSSDAWAIQAWAQSNNGDETQAIASALHATNLDPTNVRALVNFARALRADGQYSRAETVIEEALTLDPNDYEAYWVRGIITAESDFDFVTALADYQTAYDLALQSLPGMTGLIAVDIADIELRDPPDTDAAIAILEKARGMNAENAEVLYWLGSIYYSRIGDPTQALPYLQQCVDYNPTSFRCYYLLGRSQLRLDQVSAATFSLEEATRLGSLNAYHWWWAANVHFTQGNCNKAADYLRTGYNYIDPTDADIMDSYNYLISSCGLDIGIPIPTPEATPEVTPDGDSA